jgi:hypothetical protein
VFACTQLHARLTHTLTVCLPVLLAGPCDTDPLAVAVNSAYDQGLISAAAAGNEAQTNSLIIPACASKAVSVGAVHPVAGDPVQYQVCNDVNSMQPDTVACFSNRCVCTHPAVRSRAGCELHV